MKKHTTTNKFFLHRKLNKVFLKWKFFYNRYATRVAFFKKGFYIEKPTSMSQPTVNRTKDLTKMVFWLLNLTDVGYSNKLTQNTRNMNFEWELVKGEGQFIELYGDIAQTRKHEQGYRLFEQEIKSSVIDFFWDKHNIILTKADVKEVSLNSTPFSKRKFLKVSVCNKLQPNRAEKIRTDNIHSYFRKDMSLYKDKISSLDFDPAVDFRRLDLLRQPSSFTPYNEIDLYINTLGYAKNTGVSDTDVFKSLVIGGHKNGRFKILPTYVANYDDPDMLIPGLGFHNYFKVLNMKDLSLLKLFTQNSKMFMPADGLNKRQSFYDNSTNSALFYNYYSKDTATTLSSNLLVFMDDRVLGADYVMESFLHKSSKRVQTDNNKLVSLTKSSETTMKSFQLLYILFVKSYNEMLFQRPELMFFREHIIEQKLSKMTQNFGLNYDSYLGLGVKVMKTQNLLNKKEVFFCKHYANLYTMSDVFLHKWNQRLKQLFLLRVDLRSNWGYYFDTPFQSNLEEDLPKNVAPYTMDHAYKSYFEIVRNPTIIQSAKRPYKWTSIPLLQHSPFLYWMNNVRGNWFDIFDQGLGLFGLLKKDGLSGNKKKPEDLLSNIISHLIFQRYFNKNDFYYNQILKYMNSSLFFNRVFGVQREGYFNLTLYMDQLLSHAVMDESLIHKGNSFVRRLLEYTDASNILPNHLIKDLPEMNIFSLFKYNGYFKYGSSGFFEADWQTDYRTSNMSRAPLLSKIGVTPEHFSFFSFFSRDFFEQAVAYKSWMKFRTFETPYMEEKTWREFTYLHQPLIDLTTDITLSRYKADLLHLLELGFHDIVFEKEIFHKTHYLSQPLKLRDVFEFQEFTAPFFFFDSERSVFGNVPQRLPFEYVSSFGIPLLDKHWMVGDVLGSNVIRDIDRGEWYIRSKALGAKNFRRTWRKDKIVHKFVHHNDYKAAMIKQDMHIFVLTSVKGSKVYDPKFNHRRRNKGLRKPNVFGILHNSVLTVKMNRNLVVENIRETSKESIYLFQFERLYNQYMKSLFFLLLKQSFKVPSDVLYNFVRKLRSSFIWRNIGLESLFYNLFKSLEGFSKIYSLLEVSLRYQQVKFVLLFKNLSTKPLLDSLVELVGYFRMLVFIFKHNL